MTANVLEHRRAKAFAEALAAHQSADRRNGGVDDEPARGHSTAMAELLATTDVLAANAVPAPVLDPAVRAEQRARLVAAFEQAVAEGTGPGVPHQRRGAHRATAAVSGAAAKLRPRTRWGRRLAAGGLAAGIVVGGFTGVAMASTGALPGDALYGMKRSLESWQLDWAGSDSERGTLLLDQASTRMAEARQLVVRSGGAGGSSALLSPSTVEQIRKALADMHTEGTSGRRLLWSVYRSNGSLDPMRRLAVFARSQDDQWSQLREQLPQQLAPVASQVTQLLDDITADVAPLHILEPTRQGGDEDGTAGGDHSDGRGSGGGSGRSAPATQAPTGSSGRSSHGSGGAASPSGSPTPGSTPVGGVGGLVEGLTGGLTGRGTTPGTTGTATAGSTTAGGPSSSPSGKNGLTLPPLIPGLLPGLGLDLG